MDFNLGKAVPLDRLDIGEDTPAEELPGEVIVIGPDHVAICQGESFTISVDEASDDTTALHDGLRFAFIDGTLSISRAPGCSAQPATLRITTPIMPRALALAGSGDLSATALSGNAALTLTGSGRLQIDSIEAERLEVTLAGSGRLSGTGMAEQVHLSVLGSGHAELAGLKAGKADVTMAGSGRVALSCDGDVDVTILGSGKVILHGNARCRISGLGSGRVVCERPH
ncbi:GIN domain-containing protein [Croceibacterium xixiisoli]|uniref:GIN domain-containing protein n=1 Tax=Croceibacterium xixiisoli TaxID=1476466 RepID=UPI002E25B7C3